jgi:uncharacterized protein
MPPKHSQPPRVFLIRAGPAAIRARLLDTPTADQLWAALPIYATAETWGQALHFHAQTAIRLEASAKSVVSPGAIAFWPEHDRIVIAWGATPLSGSRDMRLPSPCHIWATALDDVAGLAIVRPGDRVAVLVGES